MLTYTYLFRPGYGSEHMLLEFRDAQDLEHFAACFFEAIALLEPEILKTELILGSERLFTIQCRMGTFTLSHDDYDFVFILCDERQDCLFETERLLALSPHFVKEEVSFDDYRISES